MACDWIVQVGLLPGVTIMWAAPPHVPSKISLITPSREVYTSSLYLLRGVLPRRDVERIVRDVLANPLIQQWRITAAADWQDLS